MGPNNFDRAMLRLLALILIHCCVLQGSNASIARPLALVRGGAVGSDVSLVSDDVLYDGWRRLIRRRVRLPSSLMVDFEIVAQRGTDQAVLVFVWDSRTKTATLIREYMPACHQRVLGLAAGMVELKHESQDHNSKDARLVAAEHELEEECRMRGGTWYKVTEQDSTMDKYSTTKLGVYLVIDPEPVPAEEALPRDDTEEGMEVVKGVTIQKIMALIASGQLTVVGGWACLLAINKLKEIGEVDT